MVGVPRSKGCHTCRKRRVKCDETKPACERCTKAGYTCSGYSRTIHFLNTHDGNTPTAYQGPPPSKSKTIVLDLLPFAPPPKTATTVYPDQPHQPRTSRSRSQSPPKELNLLAFQPLICNTFLLSNFVWRTYSTPWLSLSCSGKLDRLCLEASSALSMINFGTFHREKELQVKGAIGYSRAIKGIIPLLDGGSGEGKKDGGEEKERKVRMGREGLIVPILILLIYSSSQSDHVGSIYHVKGLAQLLYTCGPSAFYRQPLRSAFESARATLVTAGLISKSRTFLEQPQWQTSSWPPPSVSLATSTTTSSHPIHPPSSVNTPRNHQSHLTDILACIPGFLEDKDALDALLNGSQSQGATKDISEPSPEYHTQHQDLLKRIKQQLIKLYMWRWKWSIENEDDVSISPSLSSHALTTSVDRKGREWGRKRQTVRFKRIEQAMEILLYDAVLLWILALLYSIIPSLSIPLASPTPTATTTINSIILSAAETAKSPLAPFPTSTSPLYLPGTAKTLTRVSQEIVLVFSTLLTPSSLTALASANTEISSLFFLMPLGLAWSVFSTPTPLQGEGKEVGEGEKGEEEEEKVEKEAYKEWVLQLLGRSRITRGYTVRGNEFKFGFYALPSVGVLR